MGPDLFSAQVFGTLMRVPQTAIIYKRGSLGITGIYRGGVM